MTRTTHRGTGALIATLLAILLSLSAITPAFAAPDHRDDFALGRYADSNSWGDFSSPLTQSLALLALHRAPDTEPSEAASNVLLAQQCDDGSFPNTFRAPSTQEPAACTGGVDTTAFAVVALDTVGEADAAADAAGWLAKAQNEDGSFGAQDGINSNSTGLAALALDLLGHDTEAAKARAWILGIQDDCDSDTPGAIPFNAEDRGAPELATAQAILGLVEPGVGFADLDATAVSGEPETDCDAEEELGDEIQAAAAFLVDELGENPYVPFPGSDVPNVGGTIDVLFALAAAGTAESATETILDWLPGQAAGYTQDGEGGAGAGSSAKLALALLMANEDPTDVAGINLIEQLEALEITALEEVSISCDAEEVGPEEEVECSISGLLGGETVDVLVALNPTLLDEAVTADVSGSATFAFSVPEDATEDDTISITVDGLGVDGLANLDLTIEASEPAAEDDGEVVEEEDDEQIETITEEEDEELLPETGDGALLITGFGTSALLLGLALVWATRRQRESVDA